MRSVALVEGVVDNPMAVCHLGYYRHLVRNEYQSCMMRYVFYNFINLFYEILVDIRQRFIKHHYARVGNHSTP